MFVSKVSDSQVDSALLTAFACVVSQEPSWIKGSTSYESLPATSSQSDELSEPDPESEAQTASESDCEEAAAMARWPNPRHRERFKCTQHPVSSQQHIASNAMIPRLAHGLPPLQRSDFPGTSSLAAGAKARSQARSVVEESDEEGVLAEYGDHTRAVCMMPGIVSLAMDGGCGSAGPTQGVVVGLDRADDVHVAPATAVCHDNAPAVGISTYAATEAQAQEVESKVQALQVSEDRLEAVAEAPDAAAGAAESAAATTAAAALTASDMDVEFSKQGAMVATSCLVAPLGSRDDSNIQQRQQLQQVLDSSGLDVLVSHLVSSPSSSRQAGAGTCRPPLVLGTTPARGVSATLLGELPKRSHASPPPSQVCATKRTDALVDTANDVVKRTKITGTTPGTVLDSVSSLPTTHRQLLQPPLHNTPLHDASIASKILPSATLNSIPVTCDPSLLSHSLATDSLSREEDVEHGPLFRISLGPARKSVRSCRTGSGILILSVLDCARAVTGGDGSVTSMLLVRHLHRLLACPGAFFGHVHYVRDPDDQAPHVHMVRAQIMVEMFEICWGKCGARARVGPDGMQGCLHELKALAVQVSSASYRLSSFHAQTLGQSSNEKSNIRNVILQSCTEGNGQQLRFLFSFVEDLCATLYSFNNTCPTKWIALGTHDL